MRLYLAVAVLVLALVAFAEAQDDTIEHTINRLREHVSEVSRNVAEKVKTAVENFQNSELVRSPSTWFSEGYEKIKAHLSSGTQ